MVFPRKAIVNLKYNGVNASQLVSQYLNSFEYVDVASGASDSISISLNDNDKKWAGAWFPEKGDTLFPTISTQNWSGEMEAHDFPCGKFVIDDFSFSGDPLKVNIGALALPARSSFKTKERTETYEKTSIKGIGQKIAKRSNISLYFDAEDISIEKTEQNNQNDCEFFSRLVEKYGLALKIYNDKLVVFSEAKYEDKPIKCVLTPKDFEPGWNWNTKLVGTYTGVKYQYTNSEKNRTYTITAGTDDRLLSCNEAAGNMTEAAAIALAALNNANKDTTTMSITMMARPGLIATDCVLINRLMRLNGKYYIESITHNVGDGYKMTLQLRKVIPRITEIKQQSDTVSEGKKK